MHGVQGIPQVSTGLDDSVAGFQLGGPSRRGEEEVLFSPTPPHHAAASCGTMGHIGHFFSSGRESQEPPPYDPIKAEQDIRSSPFKFRYCASEPLLTLASRSRMTTNETPSW